MLNRFIALLFVLFAYPAISQVNVQFIPELQGRNVDGLLNIKLVSSQSRRGMSLTVTVNERRGGKVLSIKTPAFSVNPGVNAIPVTAVRPAKVQFAASKLANTIQQSGVFPEGEYEYCFTLTPEQGYYDPEVPAEQCFSAEVTPFSPLNLVEPGNLDQLCETRPLLSWQPSFPVIMGATYRLLLTEIKGTQSAVEALNYNLPLVNQANIMTPVLPYPPSARELEPGKKYAWQVSLYKNQTVLNRSEIWEFTVDCKDSVEKVADSNGGFRHINDLSRGNYYIANGQIKFYLENAYQEQELQYSFKGITDPAFYLKRLSTIKLNKGRNEITLDLSTNRKFKDGHSYVLSATLPDGQVKYLRFLYKSIL